VSRGAVVTPFVEPVGGRQQHALVFYFVLVLVGVGVAALLVARFPGLLPTTLVLLLASWIPNIVGVLVTARTDGRAGLSQLFARIVRWRFSWVWYAVALFLPVAAVLLAIGGGALFGAAPPRVILDPGVFLPLLLINVLAGPLGEELGWRGTALPRLLARWGALSSSLVLGVAWWMFHTPGFLLGLFPPGFTPLTSLVGAIALTVLITWMFNNTGGSLIPGSLMHLSVIAVVVVLAFGRTRLAMADARRATRFLPETGVRP